MALTRIFSTFAQTEHSPSAFLQDALQTSEEQFFIKKTSGRKFVTPERVGGVWFPGTIDQAVQLAQQHAPREATHFDVLFPPRDSKGKEITDFYVVRYYRL